ncbi:MAG: hypothetical protein M1821_005894 [Bathelium mastoideum]|nr:MAG: hypothetical protein M1821_005894 [Bathelium mastoideum]KAI9688570.1 MAG: hypothetical protein M1822_001519 [Bathelium mastoideum]
MVTQTTDKKPTGRTTRQEISSFNKTGKDAARDPRPSKNGAAQRAAQDLEGLKDYQLGDCLGKGAFGSVYRALNWNTGETVAVKQVRLADLPKAELRVIMLEIDLLKNLNHSNIVKYHGSVKSAESLYIILEYCENGSLHSICKNFGKFPENLVALYMSQVLNGLLYLHEQGVIHRDIKGANILTTKEGLVKLADFGVATRTTGLHEASVVGTPYWMAPEVIELSGATTASDIWSLGCTVIELLEGKPPYHQLQPMPALFRIVNDDHPPLPDGASPAVRDFLMQCFQKDPNLRVSARKLLKHPWIASAGKTEVPIKPTQYDETVKEVKQWNNKLRSPDSSQRRESRPMSLSPQPASKSLPEQSKGRFNDTNTFLPKNHKTTQPSEDNDDDVWDDDFDSIPESALQLPRQTHDNFAGALSSEKLKAFATFESVVEEDMAEEDDEENLTVRSPVQLKHSDVVEKTRPSPSPSKEVRSAKSTRPTSSAGKAISSSRLVTKPSKTILKAPQQKRRTHPSEHRPSNAFREEAVEDYSDLLAGSQDESAFQQKLDQMKRQEHSGPRVFHPTDVRHMPQTAQLHRANRSDQVQASPLTKEEATIRRTESAVNMQNFAENIDDEDFSDIIKEGLVLGKLENSDGKSDRTNLLLLNSKSSNKSWLGDEEDEEDDPFAELEEGFDQLDLDSNVARDKHARQCLQVEGLVGSLKASQPDEILFHITKELLSELLDSPEVKSAIISSHGMLPILEILENCPHRDVILNLLRIVNLIIHNSGGSDAVAIAENICFVGGIPIVSKFAHKKYSSDIRLEAAAFVRQMYQTSVLTLQMFISCGGLNVLVEFLEEDYDAESDLVLVGVNGVWSVFELQGSTPKNDFCRIFSRSSVLYPLSLVLNRVLDEEGDQANEVEGRIVNIFLLFSQAENYVKETVADRMVLKRVLKDLPRMSPDHQITMLKFIKNLSMLATTLDSLQNSNAIEVLTDLLKASMRLNHSRFREISNQVLNIMYNLCRLSKPRQEDAALNGLIPLLQKIVKTEWPLKEFALPILCDMAHSGKVGRKILWQNKGLQFYIGLLSDQYWQVTALDAIFIWSQEETAKVEEHLLESDFSHAIVECFTTSRSSADVFENLLEPLQKLLRLSPPVASTLAHPDLFSRTAGKLGTKKAVVRLNLLRIIRSICDASEEQGVLIGKFGLLDAVQRLAEHDPAILVREMAGDLLKSSELGVGRRSIDGGTRRSILRRSSSSHFGPSTPTTLSMPGTPSSSISRASKGPDVSYFDAVLETSANSVSRGPLRNGTPYRPLSRDSNSGGSIANGSAGTTQWTYSSSRSGSGDSTSSTGTSKSRLPRTTTTRSNGRLGLASATSLANFRERKDENLTPTHSPSASGRVVINQRRRRQTSSGTEGSRFAS